MWRPRVRSARGELSLPTWQAVAECDSLEGRALEQMLIGVATRQYARSLEPISPGLRSRGTSKSAVSRRFVAKTAAQLEAWRSAPLHELDLVALLRPPGPAAPRGLGPPAGRALAERSGQCARGAGRNRDGAHAANLRATAAVAGDDQCD